MQLQFRYNTDKNSHVTTYLYVRDIGTRIRMQVFNIETFFFSSILSILNYFLVSPQK